MLRCVCDPLDSFIALPLTSQREEEEKRERQEVIRELASKLTLPFLSFSSLPRRFRFRFLFLTFASSTQSPAAAQASTPLPTPAASTAAPTAAVKAAAEGQFVSPFPLSSRFQCSSLRSSCRVLLSCFCHVLTSLLVRFDSNLQPSRLPETL